MTRLELCLLGVNISVVFILTTFSLSSCTTTSLYSPILILNPSRDALFSCFMSKQEFRAHTPSVPKRAKYEGRITIDTVGASPCIKLSFGGICGPTVPDMPCYQTLADWTFARLTARLHHSSKILPLYFVPMSTLRRYDPTARVFLCVFRPCGTSCLANFPDNAYMLCNDGKSLIYTHETLCFFAFYRQRSAVLQCSPCRVNTEFLSRL